MSTPKLAIEYFNMAGRAEPARYCLWASKIPFTDIRLQKKDFAANKTAGKYPNGQVPVLHVDGEIINQSLSIARYCAKLSGHYPTNDHLTALRIDSIVDSIADVSNVIGASMAEQDKEKLLKKRKEINDKDVKQLLHLLDTKLSGSKSGFLVGDKLTLADITAYVVVKKWFFSGMLDGIDVHAADNLKNLSTYFTTLAKNDQIKGAETKSEQEIKNAAKVDEGKA